MTKQHHELKTGECIEFLNDPGPGRMDTALCCARPVAPGRRYCSEHLEDKIKPFKAGAAKSGKELARALRKYIS